MKTFEKGLLKTTYLTGIFNANNTNISLGYDLNVYPNMVFEENLTAPIWNVYHGDNR